MIQDIFEKLMNDYSISYSTNTMDGKEFDMIIHPPDGSLSLDLKVTNKTTWEEFVKMLNAEWVRRKKLRVEYYRKLAESLNDDVETPLI